MLRYVAQRAVLSMPVFLSVVSIVFVVVRVLPGDPAEAALGDYASQSAVAALRARLGLDAPLPVQYVRFLSDLARGDLGVSMINGTPIRDQVAYNLPFTVELTLAALLVGVVAGFSGGWRESLIMRGVDVLMAFPSLLLGLTVLAVLGAGLERMLFAIGIVMAPAFARMVHSATLSLKKREFVEAARAMGAGRARIVGRHVLPNLLGETAVLASLLIASAIRIEASLSFIGLGVSPPTPTWGNMIRDGVPLLFNSPWLAVFPGLAILISVLAFNLVGDGVRDVLDPRTTR